MTNALLAAHVIAALLTIGPVAVAGSMFPRPARALAADPTDVGARSVVELLHRISRVYAVIGLAIPALGVVVAVRWSKFGETWLQVSIGLTVVAALVLALGVLPEQRRVLDGASGAAAARRTAMLTGVFNLAWAAVAVLMITQPGDSYSGS